MKKQDPFLTKIYGGAMMLLVSATLFYFAYFAYNEGMTDTRSPDFRSSIAVASLIGFVGTTFIIGAYSRRFSRKFLPAEFQEDAPVIECKECLYDLRGSVLAGSGTCPECGSAVTAEQIEQIQRLDRGIKDHK
ncbi:MAG: hypothetical protein AB8C95_12275 [Phycisphaeraceae bacterium]